jgi:hypothetical protein
MGSLVLRLGQSRYSPIVIPEALVLGSADRFRYADFAGQIDCK